ncbi:CD226 antigen [Sciurus carolinensis]|uniref:CD226 antigen n=1 Tax=Sciurus carolinensis TaxID=30640 RepID=A0AA41MV74_SCICA|nr:CD226 antigen [Sciurus carolinensis]
MHQLPKQFPEMDYLTFLLAILHVHKALCEEIFWDTAVKFAENMTLECVYPSMNSFTQIEWFKIHGVQKKFIGIFHPTHGVVLREPYDKRLHLLNSTTAPNKVILSFYNASEADVGTYSCLFNVFPRGSWEKKIRVVQSDSFETAAPLNCHVVSESGKNVTLTFQLQADWPVQQVTWEKIQSHQIDLLACCNLSQGRSYTSKYPRQILSNCSQDSRRSSILILNTTASDSGLYRCRFTAHSGENETFVAKLTIIDGKWATNVFQGQKQKKVNH